MFVSREGKDTTSGYERNRITCSRRRKDINEKKNVQQERKGYEIKEEHAAGEEKI
jgi:hypothetical protein